MKISQIAAFPKSRFKQPVWVFLLFALLLIMTLFIAFQTSTINSAQFSDQLVPHAEFEAQYGLQVKLVGVSGGGGLVDFRLKMIDAEKAQIFFGNPDNLPVMLVTADGGQVLAADSIDEEVQWVDGGILFMMLPNQGGVIRVGEPVMVKFGETILEPINAQ